MRVVQLNLLLLLLMLKKKNSGMSIVHACCIIHITGIKQTSEHCNATGMSYNKFKFNSNIFKM